ncbi:MAG: DUF4339 domain-containing protein [Bacteriovoracaceae bacterium]|jgi:hypothetical protein|nr:DUF4339 domain-containing protein [Bacteriovoracaceae bacterium]
MQWFIIKNKEKRGPFTKLQLKDEIESNSDLVISEKMKSPMSFEELFGHICRDKDLPGLPDLLTQESLDLKNEILDQEESENNPKEEKLFVGEELEDKPIQQVDVDFSQFESLAKQKSTKFIAFGLLITILTCFFISYYYMISYRPSFIRPNAMGLSDAKKARAIIESNYFSQRLFFSKEKNIFWFVTNNFSSGQLILEAKSVYKKILSNKEIKFSAKAIIKDGVARFDELSFDIGQRVKDGIYEVSVQNVLPLTKKFPYTLQDHNSRISFKDTILISHFSVADFQKKINSFIQKNTNNNNEFKDELVQKYLTLKTIVTQIREAFLSSFAKSNEPWAKRVKNFEKEYTEKYGQFFTSFVIQNEKQYEQINKKEFPNKTQVISDYTRLSRLAKQTGVISVATMSELEKFPFDTALMEDILKLKEKAKSNFEKILTTCNDRIEAIQN